MEVLKVALLISTLASTFCKGYFKVNYFFRSSNIEYKKDDPICVCIKSAANSIPVDELLRHNEDTKTERLVVLLYKVKGIHYLYLPNPTKQRLIPELPYEDNDFLHEITSIPIIELFNDNPFVINKHNNEIISVEEPFTPKNMFEFLNKLIDKLNRLPNSPDIHGINDWPEHPFPKPFETTDTLFPYPAENPFDPHNYPVIANHDFVYPMLLPPQFRPKFSLPEIVMMSEYYDEPINFPVNPSKVHPYPPIWPLDQNENDDTSTVNPNMQPAIVEIVQQQYNNFPSCKTHPLIWSLVQNAKDYVTNEDQLVDYTDINPYVPYPLIWTGEENENDDAMLINLNIPPTNMDHFEPFVDPIKTPNGLDWMKLPNIDFISLESKDVRPLTNYYDKPEITYWFPSYESTQLFSPVAQMTEWIENGPPFFGQNSHDSMKEDLPCDFYRTSCKIIRIVSYLIHEKPTYEYAIDCNNHTNEEYEVDYDNVSGAPKLEMYQNPFGWQNMPLIFNEWIERQWKLIRNTSRTLTCHSFKVLVEKILLDNDIILADDGYLIDASGREVGTNELIMSPFSIGQPINIAPIRSNFNISENSLLLKGYIISSRFPPKILGFISIKPNSLKENLNIKQKYNQDRIKELESVNFQVSPILLKHSFLQEKQPQLIDERDTNYIKANYEVIQNLSPIRLNHSFSQEKQPQLIDERDTNNIKANYEVIQNLSPIRLNHSFSQEKQPQLTDERDTNNSKANYEVIQNLSPIRLNHSFSQEKQPQLMDERDTTNIKENYEVIQNLSPIRLNHSFSQEKQPQLKDERDTNNIKKNYEVIQNLSPIRLNHSFSQEKQPQLKDERDTNYIKKNYEVIQNLSPIRLNHSFSQEKQPQLKDERDTNNIKKNHEVIQNLDFGTEGYISQSDNTKLHNNGQSINPSINSNSVVDIHSNSQSNVELTSNGYSMSNFKIKYGNFLDQIQAEIDESGGNELVPSLGNYNVNLKEALFLLNLIDFRKPEMFKVIEDLDLNNLNIESLSTILINIIEAVNTQRIKHDPLTKYLEEHKTGTIDEDEPFF
ncbi:hypothetical protein JYU34_010304 [Plutella xylostella]|uniref:Uncharacterized protein n=1 Tax=Plutella xylostella TaxID=51655 RepID=A0ABQ7QJ18_PLUXY|nr:hypothetical protein JYU34_010304 [Plutella xylostella]